ncbi:phage shock protein operon transcriptional activator [Lichenicoccus roseus]|uniref:Phage shock protein operon transcriptional activator n=1 Tax=Lichenicoccus roseus TaxID=2683649 RepID=A0A5R9J4T1_9PROT|nr:phage shock protein operon transcriptional activator [Lichenicoccus roseus]TLU71863.1 phage shock protein operon transcriptional activator [Lichenicoccus roseus]
MARSATPSEDNATPLGEAPLFRDMLEHVSQAAPLKRPVLVIGERGTGKELVASRLAFLSPRWDRPFIKLNCAALDDALLDSELFGHEAGAFTGAARRRPGRFELADGGTLFLDEIATASASVQEKLLRVIEYGSFERVGGNETQRVDVRVVAATHADLPALARLGKFRADLLDRLAFDVIAVPALRDRPEDIPLLAGHFAIRMTRELGREMFAGFGQDAMAVLRRHDWPGNVRELRNVVERSVYRMSNPARPLTQIVIDPFPSLPGAAASTPIPPVPVLAAPTATVPDPTIPTEGDFLTRTRAFEAMLLKQALEAARFNQRTASRALGLTYYQFRHHLKTHGLLNRGGEETEDTKGEETAQSAKAS